MSYFLISGAIPLVSLLITAASTAASVSSSRSSARRHSAVEKVPDRALDSTIKELIQQSSSFAEMREQTQDLTGETPDAENFSAIEEKFEIRDDKPSASYEEPAHYQIRGGEEEALYTKQLLAMMRREEYISGEVSPSEGFVRQIASEWGMERVMGWLSRVYADNFGSPSVLIGLLHMISHFSYEEAAEDGPIMALALLQHESYSVREFAIKAFENWDSKKSLDYLKHIKCDDTRLQSYLDDVIRDIEG